MSEFKYPEKSILGRIERLEADVEGETKIFFDKENRNRVFDKISLLREVEASVKDELEIEYDSLKGGKDVDDETMGYLEGKRDAILEILVGKDEKTQTEELRRILGEEG